MLTVQLRVADRRPVRDKKTYRQVQNLREASFMEVKNFG
jgi:hypothetical protein